MDGTLPPALLSPPSPRKRRSHDPAVEAERSPIIRPWLCMCFVPTYSEHASYTYTVVQHAKVVAVYVREREIVSLEI